MLNNILGFIKERLSEPSTWRGIVAIITAAGVKLNPAQMEAIIALGLALIGAIGAFTPDKKKA